MEPDRVIVQLGEALEAVMADTVAPPRWYRQAWAACDAYRAFLAGLSDKGEG